MRKLLLFLLLISGPAWAQTNPVGPCMQGKACNLSVGTLGSLTVTGTSTLSGGGTLGAFTGGSLTGTDTSAADVTATGSSTARTIAGRAAGCDGDSTHCTLFDMKDWGFKSTATGATNLAALQSVAAAACAAVGAGSAGALIRIPAGSFNVAAGTVSFPCSGIHLAGAGLQATVLLVTTGTNDTFVFTPEPTSQSYAIGVSVSNMRIFTSGNPTAGALVKFNRVTIGALVDLEVDGGFRNFDCIACLSVVLDHVTMEGNNTASGAQQVVYRRVKNTLTTSAGTASGTTLFFSDTSVIVVGDTVTGTNIHSGSTVSSIVANTSVTLSAAVDGSVANGASIVFTSKHVSEQFINNSNIRSVGTTYQNAIAVGFSDGLQISNSHIGFTTGAALLVTPTYTDDQITGIRCNNTNFDTSQYGVLFSPLGGYTGTAGYHSFTGCDAQILTEDGFRVDDSAVTDVRIQGWNTILAQKNGLNIQAGTHFSIVGGSYELNNQAASTYAHIVIGGTADYVTVAGVAFHTGVGGTAVPYNIRLQDTADHISIGANTYKGASTGNIQISTTGTHYSIQPGVTDQTTNNWSWNITRTDGTHFDILADDGTSMARFATSSSGGNTDKWILQSRGSGTGGTGPVLYPSGTNSDATVQAIGTGKLILGAAGNAPIAMQVGVRVTATNAVTAHSGGGQASATAITTDFSVLGTVAAPADSVALPATSGATTGRCIRITNSTANSAQVFGTSPDTINGVATGTGVALGPGLTGMWCTAAAGAWFGGTLN